MGFKIFGHAVGLVFGHLADALRVSGVLYLLGAGLSTAATLALPNAQAAWLPTVLVNIVSAVAYIWVATAWHQYVLLDERPDSLLPTFDGRRILAYFGWSVLVSLVVGLVGVVGGVVLGFTALFHVWIITIPLGIVLALILIVMIYRLSVILPASSVGKPIGIGEAWRLTKNATWTILGTALLSVLFVVPTSLVTGALLYIHWVPLAELWSAIVGWVTLMVGVALVTSFYGYYVEGRPIVGMRTERT